MSSDVKKKSSDLEFYRIKKLLENLSNKRGFHTELISVYIPHDRKVSDVTNHLKNEISESQNIKSKLTRKNVLDGISSLLGQLRNITSSPFPILSISSCNNSNLVASIKIPVFLLIYFIIYYICL